MSEGVFDPSITMDEVVQLISSKPDNTIKEVIKEVVSNDETTTLLGNNKEYFFVFLFVLIILGYCVYRWNQPDESKLRKSKH